MLGKRASDVEGVSSHPSKSRRVEPDYTTVYASPTPAPASKFTAIHARTHAGPVRLPHAHPPRPPHPQINGKIGSSADEDEAVAKELSVRSKVDSNLRHLINLVKAKRASPEEVRRFNTYVQDIRTILQIQKEHVNAARSVSSTVRPQPGQSDLPPRHPSHVTKRSPTWEPAQGLTRPSSHGHVPRTKYPHHPDSGVGANFHSVPYPLTLLPYKTWQALHDNAFDGVMCSFCRRPWRMTPHQRKLYLVAERLSWGNSVVSVADRSKNEEALWTVNAELGIYEPAVEDEVIVVGGSQSQDDKWFPFYNECEAKAVMTVVEKADVLTDRSWMLWKLLIDEIQPDESQETIEGNEGVQLARYPLSELGANSCWLPSSEHTTKVKGKNRAIVESVDLTVASLELSSPTSQQLRSNTASFQKTQGKLVSLQDFYSILDRLERTSPMGAIFLEAYAERLRELGCHHCWLKRTVEFDVASENPE